MSTTRSLWNRAGHPEDAPARKWCGPSSFPNSFLPGFVLTAVRQTECFSTWLGARTQFSIKRTCAHVLWAPTAGWKMTVQQHLPSVVRLHVCCFFLLLLRLNSAWQTVCKSVHYRPLLNWNVNQNGNKYEVVQLNNYEVVQLNCSVPLYETYTALLGSETHFLQSLGI